MDLSAYLAPVTTPIPERAMTPEQFDGQLELMQSPSSEASTFYKEVYSGAIPESIPLSVRPNSESFSMNMAGMVLSHALHDLGYYAAATKALAQHLKEIVGDKPVLDLMAGSGYMTKALREAGVLTIATDNYSWGFEGPAEKLDALAALEKYKDIAGTVLIAWAPHGDGTDLEIWSRVLLEPEYSLGVVVIGEGVGGCTGSDAFASARELSNHEVVPYETFMGLHDYCTYHSLRPEPWM
jgi:hypothetical protein